MAATKKPRRPRHPRRTTPEERFRFRWIDAYHNVTHALLTGPLASSLKPADLDKRARDHADRIVQTIREKFGDDA